MIFDLKMLRQSNRPIVIFGAGVTGEAVLFACRSLGITVKAFCDNNKMKCGQKVMGIPVLYAPDVKNHFADVLFVVSVIDIQDIAAQFEQWGNIDFCPAAELLRTYDVYSHQYSKPGSFVEYVVSACISSQDSYIDPEKLFIRSVDLVITERCSLKCRNCSNLMQYYTAPVDYPLDVIEKSMRNLATLADEINELRIIGGEPFMNRQWPQITRIAFSLKNVNRILFYTNGTICPNPETLKEFSDSRTMFYITDYGKSSRNIDRLCDILSNLKINYIRNPAGGWTDCSGISLHSRSNSEHQDIFDCCCVKNCFTLSNGRFYRCPFAANADQLKAIPEFENDSVDLLASDISKKQLIAFIRRRDYIQACRFCSGRKLDDPQIPPAIQTPKPLAYTKMR